MKYSHLQGINIGSGQHYAEGWLNIDVIPTDKGKQPDLLMSIEEIPFMFEREEFKKAYVGHVLEHIQWEDLPVIIGCIAYCAEEVMVVGPCLHKAMETSQPKWLIDGIIAPDEIDQHPWSHKWTPLESNTFYAIQIAGYKPEVVDIATVNQPEWPNPTTAPWQTAMKFTS